MPEKTVGNLSRGEIIELQAFARGLARSGGAIAAGRYGRANPMLRFDSDLVTEVDLAIEDYIHKEVRERFPSHRFIGEQEVSREEGGGVTWAVDPIDGTASFSSAMPIWGISIAVFHETDPIIGVFYIPMTEELYSAALNMPALLNDREIRVSPEPVDNESLLFTYSRFHNDFRTNFPGKVRCLGSSAAHICYVARGAASAAILGNIHIWDIAAGIIILQSAGGVILDAEGKKFDPVNYLDRERIDRPLIAAPKGSHRDIVKHLIKL